MNTGFCQERDTKTRLGIASQICVHGGEWCHGIIGHGGSGIGGH